MLAYFAKMLITALKRFSKLFSQLYKDGKEKKWQSSWLFTRKFDKYFTLVNYSRN
jgi:hypothetical protein